jgi:NusA-like KH domain protein
MVSYNMEVIGYINLFEKVTRSHVKDCFFSEGKLVFIVQPGQLRFALGKQGANVKRVSSLLKKDIRVYEFNPSPEKFVANLMYPIRPKEVVREDEEVVIRANDVREKGQIFGRDKVRLKRMQEIVSKYFPVKIRVE